MIYLGDRSFSNFILYPILLHWNEGMLCFILLMERYIHIQQSTEEFSLPVCQKKIEESRVWIWKEKLDSGQIFYKLLNFLTA